MVIPNLLGLNSGSLPDLDPAESNILLILDPVVISGKKQKKSAYRIWTQYLNVVWNIQTHWAMLHL